MQIKNGRSFFISWILPISLLSNALKGGAGRNPKHGKKKGGIKVHTVLNVEEGVPHSIHYTSAATHDYVMLSKLKFTGGSFPALDRAYIDYKFFQQLSEDGVFYVTKMKKNMRYKQIEWLFLMNSSGLAEPSDHIVESENDEIKHTSHRIEYWDEKKKHSSVLLTNNFELDPQ